MRVKRIEMNRRGLLLLGLAILGVFSAAGLLATNFQYYFVSTGDIEAAKWPTISPATEPTITWAENFTSLPSNVTQNGGSVTPTTVLSNAFNAWHSATYNSSALTNIAFTEGAASASLPQAPSIDCKNTIGFHDTNSSDFPSGVIAFAQIATVNSMGGPVPFTYTCPSSTPTCPLKVCIVDTDIMFNPGDTFATSGTTTNQFDLQTVATHEIGHLIGLDHTGIAHAVMFPYGDTSQVGVHQGLAPDDMIGAATLYPGPAVATYGTNIQGQIKVGGTGAYAAHVQAIDATTGDVVTDTLSDPSGNYKLRMFTGSYFVYVQPLGSDYNHAPCMIGNFRGQAGYGPPSNPTDYTGAFY